MYLCAVYCKKDFYDRIVALNLGLTKMWMSGGRDGKETAEEKEREKGGMYKALSMITSNRTFSCVCAEFFQPANRFCFSCAPTCEGCTGPSPTDCLHCATGFAKEFNDDRSLWVLTVLNKQWKWYLLPYTSATVPSYFLSFDPSYLLHPYLLMQRKEDTITW